MSITSCWITIHEHSKALISGNLTSWLYNPPFLDGLAIGNGNFLLLYLTTSVMTTINKEPFLITHWLIIIYNLQTLKRLFIANNNVAAIV